MRGSASVNSKHKRDLRKFYLQPSDNLNSQKLKN
nr:MAG TPA: hypothetical protein [Caudoviricetes sp.]DAX26901.1 MAG TPA: hypothetical protein [Caudoviricetes sp.]